MCLASRLYLTAGTDDESANFCLWRASCAVERQSPECARKPMGFYALLGFPGSHSMARAVRSLTLTIGAKYQRHPRSERGYDDVEKAVIRGSFYR